MSTTEKPLSIQATHLDEIEEIEEIEATLGWSNALIAGAAAGMSEHVFMYPADTIKTRLQVAGRPGMPTYLGVTHALSQILRTEGVFRLYRGVTAIVAGAIPSHAVYFTTYEFVKHHWGGNNAGHSPLTSAAAGACATITHDAVVTPLDVLKQRMQVYSGKHTSIFSCFRALMQKESPRVLYASYPTTVAMNVPFMAMHFATYDSMKLALTDLFPERYQKHAPHLLAGATAGAVGAMASNPLDVVKTRIQVEGNLSGFRSVFTRIVSQEGVQVLFSGVSARILYHMPSSAICWTTYEAFKRWLS